MICTCNTLVLMCIEYILGFVDTLISDLKCITVEFSTRKSNIQITLK